MPISVPNPYTGKDDQTCSVSFAAQQKMAAGVSSAQTEAQYNTSKLLGEWGVVKAKYTQGQLFQGLKVLSFTNPSSGARGYLYVKDGKLFRRVYGKSGVFTDVETNFATGEAIIKSPLYNVSIPEAVAKDTGSKSGDGSLADIITSFKDHDEWGAYSSVVPKHEPTWTTLKNAGITKPGQEFILMGEKLKGKKEAGLHVVVEAGGEWPNNPNSFNLVEKQTGELINGQAASTAKWWVSPLGENPLAAKATEPIASPTPFSAVPSGSTSVGSMSHEDVAAMFVKIKDDLAKENGLNIKGANPGLDEEVYKAIGAATGYTGPEVKAKIDAYKADGNKLSALKKKVMNGSKKVPDTKPQPTKASPGAPLNTSHVTNKPVADPKPNGVPTVATPKLAEEVKATVTAKVEAAPAKAYSDEDVAAAYIIAKDAVVAGSNGKWTLYSKNDQLDLEIAIKVGLKTGLNPLQQKQAIANYLASGKKLSVLKKQLAKQGAFDPKADTLKKSGAAKDQESKNHDVNAKADAGYTPTPTPATAAKAGQPKVDTGKPAPKVVVQEAEKSGAIDHITEANQQAIYSAFKAKGDLSYLKSTNENTYEALLSVQSTFKVVGQDYTLLQLLRVIDHQGALKFKAENTKLFEKKTATWLTTPEASAFLKANEAQLAKKAEAEKVAKLLEVNQPPLPADSALFQPWSLEKAKRISQTWLETNPLTANQKAGLRHYTGNAYVEMNSYLRGLSSDISDLSNKHIANAKNGMRPTTEPILVKRGTGANQFQTLGAGKGDTSLLWGLTGRSFKDEGFLSTSAGDRAAFSGECLLEIECPVGTPMMYVDPFFKHPGENEMLLQAGLEYTILNVRKEGHQFVMRCRVVNWPGKSN